MKQLASVARHIGAIVDGFLEAGVVEDFSGLDQAMREYSHVLKPWANAVAARMIRDVGHRDIQAWKQLTSSIGSALSNEIQNAPVGHIFRDRLREQVTLITSMPLEAGKRVHELTTKALVSGRRAEEIAKEIEASGHVAMNKARLVARTEVARTASVFVETRAKHVGSEGYFWRTMGDADVRPAIWLKKRNIIGSHRKLNGKFIRWDEPPVSGQSGERAHAGQIYNCRCWPEPVLPDIR